MQGRGTGGRSGMHGGVCSKLHLYTGAGFCTGSDVQGDLQCVLAAQKPGLMAGEALGVQ